MVIQSAMNLFSFWDDEDEEETIELYHVNANNGVSDCKLRPKTGVYPGTSGSTGLGVSSGKLPDGVPTLKEMMDFELKMYEHTKVKYKSVTDKQGDYKSDGTGVGHVFSYPNNKSSWWVKKHNNKTYGYTDKGAGAHGQKLVVDDEFPFAYGTLDLNDNRQHTTDSGTNDRWYCGHTGNGQKGGYEHLGAYIRTYGLYNRNFTNGSTQRKLCEDWKSKGYKSKGGLAQFDCPDGVTRYGAVMKFTMGLYIYGQMFEVGDYIDVYYTNGIVDHYILQDSKGQENESFLMHNEGTVIEMYTTKKLPDKAGNLLDYFAKDRKGMQIAGFVKTGNYFNDAKCEKEYKVTWKDGKPGTGEGTTVELPDTGPTTIEKDGTQYVYLDDNGNPCTPEGGEKAPTVPSGGSGGWVNKFGAVTGRRTLKNFLATVLSANGHVLYVWGGGQGLDDNNGHKLSDLHGIIPEWDAFYKKHHDAGYYAWYKTGVAGKQGLDCAGFVRWALNNTMFEDPKNFIWYDTAPRTTVNAQNKGWGKRYSANWLFYNVQPGDIVNSSGHIWVIIGKCDDGSRVICHSSASDQGNSGGVHLSGTGGKAKELAIKYNEIINSTMNELYGTEKGPWFAARGVSKFNRGGDVYPLNSNTVYRWNIGPSGLADLEGVANMSAEQVLELIIGDGKASPISSTTEGETAKGAGAGRTIFLDPGHGIGNPATSGADMSALGYVKNGSSWGEWRHYDSTGLAGTMCNDCKKDTKHSCWYPLANALRDKEPILTYSIAEETKSLLEKAGYKVVMSRTKDEFPSITKRAQLAKEAGADIQICIHTNASNGSTRGVAYCSPEGGDKGVNKLKTKDWKSKSNKLNQLIYDGIIKSSSLGKYGTGVIKDYGYLVLYEKASCPTAYLEIGFHDNAEDLKILENKEEVKKIAQGIVAGINSYYGG